VTREDIVIEARSWVGTPYLHQGRAKGLGVDCGGLIGGVAVALGIVPANWWDADFAPHAGYGRRASGDSLLAVLRKFMAEVTPASARLGDVLAFRFSRNAQHLAIQGPGTMIHALRGATIGRVVEQGIDARWRGRIVSAFSYPGV
jgi:NlpC/P60 family putative phage cell wall peptidase